MLLPKAILLTVLTILPFYNASARQIQNTNAELYLKLVLASMKVCYELEKKTEVSLAKCMLAEFKKIPNPDLYRVHMNGSAPGDLSIMLYNPTGLKITCIVSAHLKIVVKKCYSSQTAPMTEGQELSITPPN